MIRRALILFFVLLAASSVWAADIALTTAEFRKAFAGNDFHTNLDAQRYEVREGDLYRVSVRLPAAEVLGKYPIPEENRKHAFWSASVKIADLDRASGGVGLWGERGGLLFYVAPNGLATLSGVVGREVKWTQRAQVAHFSFPAELSMERDPAGGVLARINGIHILSRITSPDLGNLPPEKMLDVGFVSRSPKGTAESSALYQGLAVHGWGGAEKTKGD